jgi:predicted HAD superfamily Cof-like phosphohydrolase
MEYNPQRDVAKMMRAYGQEVKSTPELPDAKTRLLRARLILEETLETITRGLGVSITYAWGDEQHNINSIKDVDLQVTGPGDLIELADGTADIKVVVYGTDNAAGLNGSVVFDEVMDSNMSKLNTDGTVTRDSFGKVVKPSHYRPADIPKVLGMKAGS